MVKVNNKNCRTTPDVVVASLLLTLNTIHIFSIVSIDFELVNVCIVLKKKTKSWLFRCKKVWNLLVNNPLSQNKQYYNKLYLGVSSKYRFQY